MKGTPNEFFSRVSEQNRSVALQTFSIIRRCDDVLRLEALVGSWLIARLISVLRMDNSAIVTETTTTTIKNNNVMGDEDQSMSVGKNANKEIDNNEMSSMRKILSEQITSVDNNNVGAVGSVGKEENEGDSTKSPTTADTSDTMTTSKVLQTIRSDKPLFVYVGQLNKSAPDTLNGFATNLAAVIASFSASKGTSTTVASTISYCLNLLEQSKHKVRLLNALCSIIMNNHSLEIPEIARIDLKRILTSAFNCILLQVKTSCEAVQDFDYIWEACKEKISHLTSIFEDNQSSKECAWLLSIVTHSSEDQKSQSLTHNDRRSARLSLSVACIAIVAQSALWLGKSSYIDHKRSLISLICDSIKDLKSIVSIDDLTRDFCKVASVAKTVNILDDCSNFEQVAKSTCAIQSLFSTHYGRFTAIAILTKYFRGLLQHSSQIAHPPNSDGPSIFSGFSFVDETLLEVPYTSYVRKHLIDFVERNNTATTEDIVAAEIQYYDMKGKEAPIPSSKEILQSNAPEKYSDMQKSLESNKWASNLLVYSARHIKPSTKLLFYIGSSNANEHLSINQKQVGNVMVSSIKNALERLCHSKVDSDDEIFQVDEIGGMKASLENESWSKIRIKTNTIGRAMLFLYYISLESVLDYETARLRTTSHGKLLHRQSFHNAMLSVCLVCVIHATSGSSSSIQDSSYSDNPHLFVESILTLMDCTAYEYMKVSESFMLSMKNSTKSIHNKICQLPFILQKKLYDTEEKIIEAILWGKCPNVESSRTMIGIIGKGRSSWPPNILRSGEGTDVSTCDIDKSSIDLTVGSSIDNHFLDYLITKLLTLVSFRVSSLCDHLFVPSQNLLPKQVWYVIIQLLRNKSELLFERHIDQLILCTIYGVAKVIKYSPELTFSKIIEVYTKFNQGRLGKHLMARILKNVSLNDGGSGTVIDFYNKVYISSMKKILLQSKQQRTISHGEFHGKNNFLEDIEKIYNQGSSKRIKLQESNVCFNFNVYSETKKPESPQSRMLYSFGDSASSEKRDLINKAMNC